MDENHVCVALQLLDNDQLHTLQSWSFRGTNTVTIGRASDQDVCIVNPQVSRKHAELRLDDDGWKVYAFGRNGVLVDGQRVEEGLLKNRCRLRLGSSGPVLRFVVGRVESQSAATLSDETLFAPYTPLELNEQQRTQAVEEIASSDFFRELQQRANQLRQRRKPIENQ